MKQTAVEWLVEAMYQETYPFNPKYSKIFEQAKEMEKEQIINAIKLVIEKEYHEQTWSKCGSISYVAEQYYNETFKSE